MTNCDIYFTIYSKAKTLTWTLIARVDILLKLFFIYL